MTFILCFLFSLNIFASEGQLFGSSSSSALGNQPSAFDDLGGFFLAPSLAAKNKTGLNLGFSYHQYQFSNLGKIVTKNPLNSTKNEKKENFDLDTPAVTMMNIAAQLPFFNYPGASLAMSLNSPANNMMNVDTTDPFLPEYAQYSRIPRSQFALAFLKKMDSFDMALGVYSGMKAQGETQVIARTNGDPDGGSSGRLQFSATPSQSFFASVSQEKKYYRQYLSYFHEMKSVITNHAYGLTPAGGEVKYNMDLSALAFYDPKILRYGFDYHFENMTLYSQVAYEDWSGYESPVLKIKKISGVIEGSENYHSVKTKNILVPSLGLEIEHQKWISRYGVSYRPGMLKNTQNGASNLLDNDAAIFSLGCGYNLSGGANPIYLNASLSRYEFVSRKVHKSAGREDNDGSQDKIGSPGYTFDGSITSLMLSLSWNVL